jgi:hypothetical protein
MSTWTALQVRLSCPTNLWGLLLFAWMGLWLKGTLVPCAHLALATRKSQLARMVLRYPLQLRRLWLNV